MLKLGRVTKFKMLFLVLVFVYNFDLFKFSAAILEKGLLIENRTIRLNVMGNKRKQSSTGSPGTANSVLEISKRKSRNTATELMRYLYREKSRVV